VQIAVSRGAEKFGTLVLNGQTTCWIPAPAEEGGVDRQLTWLMPWEQFAAAMQSADLGDIGQFDQSVYVPASRVSAPEADASFGSPMPDAREELGLRRRFNIAEFALIRKGFPPEWDAHWGICFDPVRSELRMCRSWTGACIYLLSFREDSEGAEISEAWVSREPGQQSDTTTEHDAEVASWLIDVFLLGRKREFPVE